MDKDKIPKKFGVNQTKMDMCSRVLAAFMGPDGSAEALTWKELLNRAKISKASLSKYLVVLFEENFIKSEGRVVNHKIVDFYMLQEPDSGAFYSADLIGESTEAVRILLTKDTGHPIEVQRGVLRRTGKKEKGKAKENFVRTGPILKHETSKD